MQARHTHGDKDKSIGYLAGISKPHVRHTTIYTDGAGSILNIAKYRDSCERSNLILCDTRKILRVSNVHTISDNNFVGIKDLIYNRSRFDPIPITACSSTNTL